MFLIGFMGAGKTSLGKKLAKKLNLQFIDLDYRIEQHQGMSIKQIFDKYGEVEFRRLETEQLTSLSQTDNFLISLGGGTPCYNNNIELVNNYGISVYLKLSVQQLHHRLQHSKTVRPLLHGLNDSEKLAVITELFKKREPIYEMANLTIGGANLSSARVEEMAVEITNYSK